MHRGYTKRWRKRWDKGYHQDLLLWVMMDYFIDFANWKDSEFPYKWKGALVEMVKVKRGECFFTFQGLADKLRGPLNPVSRKMIRSRVKVLEKIGFLERKEGRKYQIISVLNYDKYNPLEEDGAHQSDHQRDAKGTLKGHQRDTSNKDNKDNKVKKVNNKEQFKAFALPDKETIKDAAERKILADIETVTAKLYQENIFPKVHAYKNAQLKKTKNPRAVLHVLSRCYLKKTFESGPWAYCEKIMQVENGNYNESDYTKITY